jgi:N6-adenosine-specific RNA methylase IME4
MVWGAVHNHYHTMRLNEIKSLPVGDIAEKDCAIFMWATFPMLREALETIEAWGFKYKTVAFVWAKQNRNSPSWFWGLGNWTRSNAEICLLGTKGRPERISASVHSIVVSPVGKHSEKPPEVRDRIVQLMGDVPKIELFARKQAEGWDAWGNEV